MTKNQAEWASSHDWFRGYFIAECGGFSVIVRPDTGETDTVDYFGKPAKIFTSLVELKAWAGY